MMKRTTCCLLFALPMFCLATTQNGAVGNPSTGFADINFEISQLAAISGLRDISFPGIDPRSTKPPFDTIENVCLYSSTGSISVTTSVDNGLNPSNQQQGIMVSEHNNTTYFTLKLGESDLLGSTPTFNSSISSQTCSDHVGEYPLTVTLSEVPKRAGTYQAVVHLQVNPA